MDKTLMAAVQAVYADFMPAERSTDLAATQTARLLATILEQRTAAGLAIGTGAPLIRKLSKSLSAQIDAREEFIMAHKLAAAIPMQLGIDMTQFGDTEPCPDVTGQYRDDGAVQENAPVQAVRLVAVK